MIKGITRRTFFPLATVLCVFSLVFSLITDFDNILQLIFPVVLLILVNTILHSSFCASGELPWYALPLMWLSCAAPLCCFIYYIDPPGVGSFGPAFEFGFFFVVVLCPVIMVSFLTGWASFIKSK